MDGGQDRGHTAGADLGLTPMPRPGARGPSVGSLVIVGGAEDRSSSSPVLQRLMSSCTDREPSVLVVDAASRAPSRMVRHYVAAFAELGAREVNTPRLDTTDDAEHPSFLEAVQRANAVYFAGGDQSRLARILLGTSSLRTMLDRHRSDGLAVGGTSAGAAALSRSMIARGESELWPRKGYVRLAQGLGFTSLVIDQHFAQRGRLGRLMEALARLSSEALCGIGVDENTALILHGDGQAEVVGEGGVAMVRLMQDGVNAWQDARTEEIVPLRRVELAVLRHGDRIGCLRAACAAAPGGIEGCHHATLLT